MVKLNCILLVFQCFIGATIRNFGVTEGVNTRNLFGVFQLCNFWILVFGVIRTYLQVLTLLLFIRTDILEGLLLQVLDFVKLLLHIPDHRVFELVFELSHHVRMQFLLLHGLERLLWFGGVVFFLLLVFAKATHKQFSCS